MTRGQALLLAAVTMGLLAQGCGYRKTMEFRSPSGQKSIEIWQTSVDNSWHGRVALVVGQRSMVIYRLPSEAFIHFVHVYWSPNEEYVGAIARGMSGFTFACETKTGAMVPFDLVREGLARSIVQTYRVPRGEKDPIGWAGTNDAVSQFFQLHPEIRLTYIGDR